MLRSTISRWAVTHGVRFIFSFDRRFRPSSCFGCIGLRSGSLTRRSTRTRRKRRAIELARCGAEKAGGGEVGYRGRRIGAPGLTQALIELLVCEQRVHVCGGLEAKERAVRRPGEQRPMKQSRKAKIDMQRA